jgi:hypothetical protein
MTKNVEVKLGNSWFLTVLLLIFITLKLTGVIAWSWWWVLAPFWIPLTIGVVFLAIVFVSINLKKR